MIKAVFFDIDGTLLPFGKSEVPQSAVNSISKLREKGIKVFVATGKSLTLMLRTSVKNIAFDGYLTLNGQLAYDDAFNMIFGVPIVPEEMEILSHVFRSNKVPFEIIGEFARYINYVDERVKKNVANTNSLIPSIEKYKGEKVYQITAYTDAHSIELLRDTMELCKVTFWAPDACDIVAKDGGKENGIKKILELYGISKEETMAFGDSQNDIGMLELVGTGVAMGNALEITKDVADYITADIEDAGVEKALKHFGLI